jgi:hypothetical protein
VIFFLTKASRYRFSLEEMEMSCFLLTAMPVGEFHSPALAAAFPIVSGCCCNQLDMLGSLVIKQLARGGMSQSRKGEVFQSSFHEFSRKLQTVRFGRGLVH